MLEQKTFFDSIRNASQFLGKVSVSSSLNPLLWICGLIGSPSLLAFIISDSLFVKIMCLLILGSILVVIFSVYIYFMVKSPDSLRSEKFLIQKQTLGLLGDQTKGLPTGEVVELMKRPVLIPDDGSED